MSNFWFDYKSSLYLQKHSLRGVRRERCSENVQQIYGEHARTPKCDFSKVTKWLY